MGNAAKNMTRLCTRVITALNNLIIGGSVLLLAAGIFAQFAGSLIQPHVEEMIKYVTDQFKKAGIVDMNMSSFDVDKVCGHVTGPLVITGLIYLVVSVLGTLAARRKIYHLLIPYAAFLVLTAVIQFAVLIMVFVNRRVIDGILVPKLTALLHERYIGYNETDVVSQTWNIVMISLNCCGLKGYKDFEICTNWRRKLYKDGWWFELKVPVTCCKLDRKEPDEFSCAVNPSPYASNYERGCYETVWSHIGSYKMYAFVIIGGIVFIQLAAFIATVILVRNIIKEKKKTQVEESGEEGNENEMNARNESNTNNNRDVHTDPNPSVRDGLFSFLPFSSFPFGVGFNQFAHMNKRYSMPPDVLSMFLMGQNGCPTSQYNFNDRFGRTSFPDAFGNPGPVIVQMPPTPPVLKAITNPAEPVDRDIEMTDEVYQELPGMDQTSKSNHGNKFQRCSSESCVNVPSSQSEIRRIKTIAR